MYFYFNIVYLRLAYKNAINTEDFYFYKNLIFKHSDKK